MLAVVFFACLIEFCVGHRQQDGPSNNECAWTTSRGYQLDLSPLYGSTISFTDSTVGKTYVYSPCNNGVICSQNDSNIDAMATQEDDSGFCVSYLAKYDDTVEPTYSVEEEIFTFEYTNGETSGICDEPREFIIQWQCFDTTTSLYKVLSASEVASCIYLMTIESIYACPVTQSTSTMAPHNGTCVFGMYDYSDTNADVIIDNGWELISLARLSALKWEFVAYYNNNSGLTTIADFSSSNCCFAFSDNRFLAVNFPSDSLSVYEGNVAPYSVTGLLTCNPSGGYGENQNYVFERLHDDMVLATLDYDELLLNSTTVCNADEGNPGIYVKDC